MITYVKKDKNVIIGKFKTEQKRTQNNLKTLYLLYDLNDKMALQRCNLITIKSSYLLMQMHM